MFFLLPTFWPKSIPWISFFLCIPMCFSSPRYFMKGSKAICCHQQRWNGIIYRESHPTMIFPWYWWILLLCWTFTMVSMFRYNSQPFLMDIYMHPYEILAFVDSVQMWQSFLLRLFFICDIWSTWLECLQCCFFIQGAGNMNYICVQWIGNRRWLRNYRFLYLIWHSMSKVCHQICITYGTLYDLTTGLW